MLLQTVWENEHMQSFSDLLEWYNNNDAVPPMEAMQKTIEFYHNKEIDMSKLRVTLPNWTTLYLHKSTDSNFTFYQNGQKFD